MGWQKSSPELCARFDAALPDDTRVERRRMFGYPCAFVNGHMFTGLHEQNLIVRLPEDQRVALIGDGRARAFAVMGRTMREYVAVNDPLDVRERRLREWLAAAFTHTAGLPTKPARKGSGAASKPKLAKSKVARRTARR
jgi:TfoX/Sxy family transcriptional regulator of competence genes